MSFIISGSRSCCSSALLQRLPSRPFSAGTKAVPSAFDWRITLKHCFIFSLPSLTLSRNLHTYPKLLLNALERISSVFILN